MVAVSRRAVLSGAAGAAALGGLWHAQSPAFAGPAAASAEPATATAAGDLAGDCAGVAEQIVRDAAMAWQRVPDSWRNGPFLGNGHLGVQVYRAKTANVLTFMLSHSEVQDQRGQWEA